MTGGKNKDKKPNIQMRSEEEKVVIMWAGIGLIMALVFGFWIYNTKMTFNKINLEAKGEDSITDLVDNQGLSGIVKELREGVAELQKLGEDVQALSGASSTGIFPPAMDVEAGSATQTVDQVLPESVN
jgi:hypothetical protein